MKFIYALLLSLLFSFSVPAYAQANEDVWETLILDKSKRFAHDLNIASIYFLNKTEFVFMHRVRFRKPINTGEVVFDTITVISYGNCQTRQTKMMEDYASLNDQVVAKNGLSPLDELKTPDESTIHGLVLTGVCGKDPSFQI
jgi:hypothetical protein